MLSTAVSGMLILLLAVFINLDAAPLVDNPAEAKTYLQRFNHMGADNMRTGELLTEDDFVAALESFQSMANLTVTGELDDDTMAMMNLPRCGMPDNMGFSNAARRRRYAAMTRWSKNDLTWRINSFSPDLANGDITNIMRDALKVWSDVSQLEFQESSASGADIIIDFAEGSHGDGNPFDGPNGVLAHAYFPIQTNAPSIAGDAHFDEAETFTQFTNTGINLFQVAAHEFGHSLGLGHSEVPDALMGPFYRGYIPNFVLHEDDVAGIQYLYGEDSGEPDMTMPPMTIPQEGGCPGSKIDTFVRTGDGRTFAFEGSLVYEVASGVGLVDGYPLPISQVFPGLPNDIDAGFYYPSNGRTYFFKGGQYWRFSSTSPDSGYPRSISQWGLPSDIDSAFVWSGNGRLYFTKGDQYYRYNTNYGRIDNGYPRPLAVWGFPAGVDRIDAAQQWQNRRTYFYVGDVYYRYDDSNFKVDTSYPRSTAFYWFGCGENLLLEQGATTESTGGGMAVSVPSKLALVLTTALALMHLL